MKYRSMQISDYDPVIELWRNCEGLSLRDADSRAGIEKYLLRNPGLSFVAEDETGISGSIMAGHDGKRGYIQHLAVDPARRKRGIAGKLVALSLDALKSQGIEKSHVHVLKENQAGRSYWSSRGWSLRAEIEMYSFINGDNENT